MKKIPKIIKEVGFEFSWDEKKVWALNASEENIDIKELEWHFEIPFWNSNNGCYDLKPKDVIDFPEKYQEEYDRIIKSDLKFPIDIMENKGRWVILDGLHRLTKSKIFGKDYVKVRKIPHDKIPKILK